MENDAYPRAGRDNHKHSWSCWGVSCGVVNMVGMIPGTAQEDVQTEVSEKVRTLSRMPM